MKPLPLIFSITVLLAVGLLCSACTTVSTLAEDAPSRSQEKYRDSRQQSDIETLDIESGDLHSACGALAGKILAHPRLAGQAMPPHIAVEPACFKVETGIKETISAEMVTDLVRTALLDAADGRVVLVGREYLPWIAQERQLQQYSALKKGEALPEALADKGPVGPGVTLPAKKTLGVDYLIGGRITDKSVADLDRQERYTQIAFEVVDAKTAEIVLCELYYFKKRNDAPKNIWHH
jgi:curli biogenesis system outer membrane secretion channel CsgG